jgi:hypothetical protein
MVDRVHIGALEAALEEERAAREGVVVQEGGVVRV